MNFDLRDPPAGFVDDPYPVYRALRESEPVRRMPDGSVFLTRFDDLSTVYRSPCASSDKTREFAPRFGQGSPLFEHHTTSLVFNDPPLHTRVRRLLLGALNQRAIARMERGVVLLVDGLLDALPGAATGGAVDLIEHFASAIPVEVIGNLLAFPREDRAPLRGWSLAILAALEPRPDATMLAAGHRAVSDFAARLDDLIAERRAKPLDPDEDVLTRLIEGEVDGERLSAAQLVHNCIFLLNAGHETTANLIGNGVDALMRFPDEQRRLVANPRLLPSAIEELLRFESPLQLNNRALVGPLDLGAERLDAGTLVTLCIGAANRDPAQFADPDRLDVGRRPNRQLAFGHGDHACAGMNVARLEARIAIGALLARHPRIVHHGDPVRDRRVRFRGFSRLPVALHG
ncbi:MAG: cytochrome P450 [Lautropia sp.]